MQRFKHNQRSRASNPVPQMLCGRNKYVTIPVRLLDCSRIEKSIIAKALRSLAGLGCTKLRGFHLSVSAFLNGYRWVGLLSAELAAGSERLVPETKVIAAKSKRRA